ncbi:MAG: DUF4278 domain-containing protein [Cyanobacteria bacterium P01_E01_bin.35]
MQLRFLGQTYFNFNSHVETIPLDRTGKFLGQIYTLRRPVQTFKPKPQLGVRKYRGVSYGA